MKRILFYLSALCCLSCTELMFLSVEQMLPPEAVFEHAVRSVGVVSNFSQNNVVAMNDNAIILPCDVDTMKNQVAQVFADAGCMERVVVLDSLLYHPDSTTLNILSQTEVNALCHELDVEMIYSIDYACLTFNTTAQNVSHSLNAYLCSHIYIPDCDSMPGLSIPDKETLNCAIDDVKEIDGLIPQIPHLLAQSAIAPYLPSWKKRERVYFYDRLCYPLREAKVYVYENNWEAAAEQWRTLAASRWRPYRFMAYYNLALYYEMTDRIDQAISSLELAEEVAATHSIDTSLLNQYREVLQNRRKELALLVNFKN